MACTRNRKKFLFIHWMGPHKFMPVRLRKFMPTSEKFIVDEECLLCEATKSQHFISKSDLLKAGLSIDTMRAAENNMFGVYLK